MLSYEDDVNILSLTKRQSDLLEKFFIKYSLVISLIILFVPINEYC